jgi:hypothetical protein
MGRSLAWLLPVVITAALVAGRMRGTDSASASASARVYTGRHCDVFRVPSTATRCEVTVEGAFPDSFAAASGEADTRSTSLAGASSSGVTGTRTLLSSPRGGDRRAATYCPKNDRICAISARSLGFRLHKLGAQPPARAEQRSTDDCSVSGTTATSSSSSVNMPMGDESFGWRWRLERVGPLPAEAGSLYVCLNVRSHSDAAANDYGSLVALMLIR